MVNLRAIPFLLCLHARYELCDQNIDTESLIRLDILPYLNILLFQLPNIRDWLLRLPTPKMYHNPGYIISGTTSCN